jgi:uncharacterized membrane protein
MKILLIFALSTIYNANKRMDIFNFLGKFHLILLHFPIGILMLVAFLEGIAHFYKKTDWQKGIHTLLLGGVVFTFVTAYLGWVLAGKGDFDTKLLFWHKWLGFATAATGFLLWWFKNTKWYFPIMGICMVFLLGAGHYGGALSHGEDYLTEPFFPTPIFSSLPIKKPAAHEKIYHAMVEPILQKKCLSCHNKTKTKGKLNLETPENLLKGGENGLVIVPKNADLSQLYQRTQLPMNDARHMPPRSRVQLTKEEIEVLKWWINEGADFKLKMETVHFPIDLQKIWPNG